MAVRAYPEKIFQSTLPARGATRSATRSSSSLTFQSTLPARGATYLSAPVHCTSPFQSTLPARGATQRFPMRIDNRDFNPRSPHGERPLQCFRLGQGRHFNPRSPHGERLDPTKLERTSEKFQSTLPARGATLIRWVCCRGFFHFNPRSPHGERRRCFSSTCIAIAISIHAPRTGSDAVGREPRKTETISIHAPRTGSDSRCGR